MIDEELELELTPTPTPTPTPVVVTVENIPDIGYLSEALNGQAEQLETIQEQIETINLNTGVLFGVEYFMFVLVMFEVLRFVKGLKKKGE